MILTSDRKKRIQYSFSVFQYLYFKLFHDGGPYHIETNPLICSAYQWTSFYMIGASVMNKLIRLILVTLSMCSFYVLSYSPLEGLRRRL